MFGSNTPPYNGRPLRRPVTHLELEIEIKIMKWFYLWIIRINKLSWEQLGEAFQKPKDWVEYAILARNSDLYPKFTAFHLKSSERRLTFIQWLDGFIILSILVEFIHFSIISADIRLFIGAWLITHLPYIKLHFSLNAIVFRKIVN